MSRPIAVALFAGLWGVLACTSAETAPSADAGPDVEPDGAGDVADAAASCLNKACGETCDVCEWGACEDAAPHALACNRVGKCQYVSMTAPPPACAGPTECGAGQCADGFSCHCPLVPERRCCPVGTECEPCSP